MVIPKEHVMIVVTDGPLADRFYFVETEPPDWFRVPVQLLRCTHTHIDGDTFSGKALVATVRYRRVEMVNVVPGYVAEYRLDGDPEKFREGA
jgi:hypothetical protein